MSAELMEYTDLIEDLKTVVKQPDFDQVFKSKTNNVPKGKQFLIKMELKRLSQPCNRLLDLRGNVIGEPQEYEYKGQIHYLDEMAKNIFEDQLNKFGQYTIGGYEAVLAAENNHRVLHKKEQAERLAEKSKSSSPLLVTTDDETEEPAEATEFPGHLIHFTEYSIRKEERMNFSIEVELQFALGDILKAQSSDLSIGGIKVKIPEARKVAQGQKIAIFLTGLQKEFELGLSDGIQYQIVGMEPANTGYQYVRMRRTFDEDIAAFDEFLGNFINGNKHRYKVNLENTQEAVLTKGYEQFYLPRIATMAIFLKQVKHRRLPTMALATENNRGVLGYFSDENRNLVFQQILNEERMENIQASLPTIKETLLFTFTHIKGGKIYFYSATTEELENKPELKNVFLGFGSQKDSWRVFKLQLLPANENDAHLPLTIPDTASEEIKKANRPPSPKVKGLVSDVCSIVLLTPIEKPIDAKHYLANYPYDKGLLKRLAEFGHPKLKRYLSVEVETVEYVNLRSEERYLYKTTAQLEDPEDESMIKGSTRDFSTYGLQIVLNESGPFSKGDIVLLSLPELQKISSKYVLSKLPYEVMAISRDKTVMNLRVYEPKGVHTGRHFFRSLINQNRHKLTPAKMESRYPGLSKALRNIFASQMPNIPWYVNKQDSKLLMDTMGASRQPNLLQHLMIKHAEQSDEVNLFPLLKDGALMSIFAPILQDMERIDRPRTVELFIRYRDNQDSADKSFICQYDEKFLSDDMLSSFVKASTKNDVFIAVRIYLSKTGRPDMNYISSELKYVSHYAHHRAKELEQKLWATAGVADIIDISDEVMMRLGCSREIMQKQIEKKNKLLNS